MAKKLYIGGIPYSSTEDALREVFTKVGEVASVNIITDRVTGRSRGFGFVEMANDADADRAVETLNGTDFEGRSISVSEARPMSERKPSNSY